MMIDHARIEGRAPFRVIGSGRSWRWLELSIETGEPQPLGAGARGFRTSSAATQHALRTLKEPA